jgi:hypothetical protein
MRIEGYKGMRGGEYTSVIIPTYKAGRCHILIFSNHTRLVHHSFSEGGFERRKK